MEFVFIVILAIGALVVLTKQGEKRAWQDKEKSSKKITFLPPIEQAFDYRNRLSSIDTGSLQGVLAGAIYELATYRKKYPNIVDWLKKVDAVGASEGLPALAEVMQEDLRDRQVRGDFVSASHLMPLLFAVRGAYDKSYTFVAIEIWNKLAMAREIEEVALALEGVLTIRNADPSIDISVLDLNFMPLALYEIAKDL